MTSIIRIALQHFRFTAISLAAFSMPVSAAYTETIVGGWMVRQDGNSCAMLTQYESNTAFTFEYVWFDQSVNLRVWNKNWASLKDKESAGVDLEINFEGNVEYDEFWQKPATVLVLPATENEPGLNAVSASWDREHSQDLLQSLAMSSGFSLIIDKKFIGSFDSKDTLQSVKEIYKCAADGRINSGQDPFAN